MTRLSPIVRKCTALSIEPGHSTMVQSHDVKLLPLAISKHGPDFWDILFLHIEETSTQGSTDPFVQAGAIIITIEVIDGEIKMAKRMGAIDHHFNAPGMRHITYFSDRQDVSGDIHITDVPLALP